jgi:anti-sigma factor RsiW
MTVTGPPTGNDPVPQELGHYVLGALLAAEASQVERYLAMRGRCRAQCDDVGDVAV